MLIRCVACRENHDLFYGDKERNKTASKLSARSSGGSNKMERIKKNKTVRLDYTVPFLWGDTEEK